MGVILNGEPKAMLTLKSNYLKEFISGNEGLDCTGFNNTKSCIRTAMANLKEQAYEGHVVSQLLLSLMYFQKEKTHWWVDLNKKFGNSGAFVLRGRQIDYKERESLMKRENMKIWSIPS